MEASYFYYRPSDLIWDGNNRKGHFLDKGFNVKFTYKPKKTYIPNLAIGLDDFAGTGLFTREYFVATSSLNRFKYTLGIGWGGFVGDNQYKNPLSNFSNKFISRPSQSKNYEMGGQLANDQWFRGNTSIFGGLEIFVPRSNGSKIKIEYDPTDYFNFSSLNRNEPSYDLRKKDSNFNIGVSMPINDYFTIDSSFIKGNTFNIGFNFRLFLKDSLVTKNRFTPNIISTNKKNTTKNNFYEDLLFNLNKNDINLQTATLNKDKLDLYIMTSKYRNPIRSSSYSAYISNEISKDYDYKINNISVTHINAGIELNKIKYYTKSLNDSSQKAIELKKQDASFQAGSINSFKDSEFKPQVNFPEYFSSTNPIIVSHIGNPEKFYFGGIAIQHAGETQFTRNLILTSELNYSLYNNFKDTVSGPGSLMQHVRTDIVEYLKNSSLYLSRFQLDYIWSPRKNIYSKLSAGIFEMMYGGFGGEFLYKPFNKNFTIGLDLFYVKQRDFDQKFTFRDYETSTGHLTFGYSLPLGIESKLSFGRYLAKDDGYTLDLSKTSKSGFKSGFYFSRTDVSSEIFGEGSFDKGFYFQIPLDLFSNDYSTNYSNFKASPLTRDGGAKLEYGKELRGLIYNSTYKEINKGWHGFLN